MPRSRPEDAERRHEARERAERLDSRRGQFNRWMEQQGKSEEERERGLRQLDDVVEGLRREADR